MTQQATYVHVLKVWTKQTTKAMGSCVVSLRIPPKRKRQRHVGTACGLLPKGLLRHAAEVRTRRSFRYQVSRNAHANIYKLRFFFKYNLKNVQCSCPLGPPTKLKNMPKHKLTREIQNSPDRDHVRKTPGFT